MKIEKFKIENYKAIIDTEIKLNYSINPIVGVNESGKTSILQAILAFDKNRDSVNAGRHLEYQNKYSTKVTESCKISVFLKLKQYELDELINFSEVKTGSSEYDELSSLDEKSILIITRELSTENKRYSFGNDGLSEKTEKKVTKYLLNKFPYILYFDDFTDRVPEEVVFKEDYTTTGKFSQTKVREWQEIIVEIFRRAQAEGIENEESPLKQFFNLTDQDRKDDILSDIQDVLNHEIIDEWKRIKQSGHQNFADDSDNLSLELKCDGTTFYFKVKDKSNKDKKRTFNVNERSKGFQWFFNYMIKLKFNPRYRGSQENSIFLLDEPGSYLHSSAQSELLTELKSVSKKNIIIYCTHSQYLLNPKIIKLGSIKIAEKKDSIINLVEYGIYKSKDDKGALSAVYQALQLNFMQEFVGNIVITEGVTDFYFFDLLKRHTKIFQLEFKIIPGAGSGNLTHLISVGLSFSEHFVVLFDNDGGTKAIDKYRKEFGFSIDRFFYIYSTEINFRLENFLSNEDRNKLLVLCNTNDVKRAFSILYYDIEGSKQSNFIKNLNNETLSNIERTVNRINNLNNNSLPAGVDCSSI